MDMPVQHRLASLSAPITKMIRMDHSHVMVLSHRHTADIPDWRKKAIAASVCLALEIHAQLEEEIFYPALREVFKDTEHLAEAEVEHQSAKELIAQIEAMPEADEMFDAKVKVLGEYVDHHIKEERAQLFPKARSARKLDLFGPVAGMTT